MRRRCISFIGNDDHGFLVAGNIDLHMNEPIASIKDIEEIQDCIKMKNHLVSVAVINIIDYEEGV